MTVITCPAVGCGPDSLGAFSIASLSGVVCDPTSAFCGTGGKGAWNNPSANFGLIGLNTDHGSGNQPSHRRYPLFRNR